MERVIKTEKGDVDPQSSSVLSAFPLLFSNINPSTETQRALELLKKSVMKDVENAFSNQSPENGK